MLPSVLPVTFSARPHDLLLLHAPDRIENFETAPAWVRVALNAVPYVVVRRQQSRGDAIAIGVRGETRSERWAGWVAPGAIKARIAPVQLRASNVRPERFAEIAALQNLLALEAAWHNLDHQWGPGGSVGFELASGYPVTTATSDLDVVLFAPHPFDKVFARMLFASAEQISSSIDILVEAPNCAFHLHEFAAVSEQSPILLRTIDGPRLSYDPWNITEIN